MHGIILKGLKDFVVDQYDEETWRLVCEEADVGQKLYIPVTTYPDDEVYALVEAAAELSGEEQSDLLYEFGRFAVPALVGTYGIHVDADWTGLELVENVETYIHHALRAKNISKFDPPAIQASRLDADRVLVEYGCDCELCDIACGLLSGVGDYYEEAYEVHERQCMHDGASRCEIVVAKNGATARGAGG